VIKKSLILITSLLCLLGLVVIALGFIITLNIEKTDVILAEGETWFDDWYTVSRIDGQTFGIGEPRYWQRNYNYLLIGEERALLFDTGPGVRNIKPVIESLTSLPVTVVSSHPHYDHIGNNYLFDRIAWLDVPSIRKEVKQDTFYPSFKRGFTIRSIPAFAISEWWQPNQDVDLGNRRLTVFYVPGHEEGSIALYEPDRKLLFSGDFIYPGWLVAFAPTSDLGKYLSSTQYLIQKMDGDETLLGAHSVPEHPSPAMPFRALIDLEKSLLNIIDGTLSPDSHFPIRIYPVNDDMEIYLPPI
jgi:glyoxylase-like metal-dependent hydrolase (beta-lactamase superfamily II)